VPLLHDIKKLLFGSIAANFQKNRSIWSFKNRRTLLNKKYTILQHPPMSTKRPSDVEELGVEGKKLKRTIEDASDEFVCPITVSYP
jgi:hypothetical protein